MSYLSVRQQLLKIAAEPLPTSRPKPTLDDVITAARGIGPVVTGFDLALPEPTLYERVKTNVIIFIYHTIPKLVAGA